MPSPLPPIPRIKIVDVGAMTLGDGTEAHAKLMAVESIPNLIVFFLVNTPTIQPPRTPIATPQPVGLLG